MFNSLSSNIAGVILAGGQSLRMGEDKSALRLCGKTLLQHMEVRLKATGIESVYINNDKGIADELEGKGPLSGVHATLKALEGKYHHILYVPVDMPALQPSLLQQLISAADDCDIVRFEDYMLPFRLKVKTQSIHLLEKILTTENYYSLKGFQRRLSLCALPVEAADSCCFANINTLDEWNSYKVAEGD